MHVCKDKGLQETTLFQQPAVGTGCHYDSTMIRRQRANQGQSFLLIHYQNKSNKSPSDLVRKTSDWPASHINSGRTPKLEFKSDSRRDWIRIERVTKNGALPAARLITKAPESRTLTNKYTQAGGKIGSKLEQGMMGICGKNMKHHMHIYAYL